MKPRRRASPAARAAPPASRHLHKPPGELSLPVNCAAPRHRGRLQGSKQARSSSLDSPCARLELPAASCAARSAQTSVPRAPGTSSGLPRAGTCTSRLPPPPPRLLPLPVLRPAPWYLQQSSLPEGSQMLQGSSLQKTMKGRPRLPPSRRSCEHGETLPLLPPPLHRLPRRVKRRCCLPFYRSTLLPPSSPPPELSAGWPGWRRRERRCSRGAPPAAAARGARWQRWWRSCRTRRRCSPQ